MKSIALAFAAALAPCAVAAQPVRASRPANASEELATGEIRKVDKPAS